MNLLSNKKIQNLIRIFICVIIYCVVLKILNISCPIKFLTGISCAGCGMTRAYLSLIQGNIKEAFTYHPLFWTVPIAIIVYIVKDRLPKKVLYGLIGICITAFMVCYIIRMFNPNDLVVVCNIKESIFYKIITGGNK